MLRRGFGRDRLDKTFLLVRPQHHDDLVGGKARERIAHGEPQVGLTGNGVRGLARQHLSRSLSHLLSVTECLLVVREPVEKSLPDHRHDHLDGVGLADVSAQELLRMFDGADHEHISTHDRNSDYEGFGRVAIAQPALHRRPHDRPHLAAEPQKKDGAQTEHRRALCTTATLRKPGSGCAAAERR